MPLTLSMWSAMCWVDHWLAHRLVELPCWQSCGTVSKGKKSYRTFRQMCHQQAKSVGVSFSISNSEGQCFEMLNNCRPRKREVHSHGRCCSCLWTKNSENKSPNCPLKPWHLTRQTGTQNMTNETVPLTIACPPMLIIVSLWPMLTILEEVILEFI